MCNMRASKHLIFYFVFDFFFKMSNDLKLVSFVRFAWLVFIAANLIVMLCIAPYHSPPSSQLRWWCKVPVSGESNKKYILETCLDITFYKQSVSRSVRHDDIKQPTMARWLTNVRTNQTKPTTFG